MDETRPYTLEELIARSQQRTREFNQAVADEREAEAMHSRATGRRMEALVQMQTAESAVLAYIRASINGK